MGRSSGTTCGGQEKESESGAVGRYEAADPARKQQCGATPHHAQAMSGKGADHAEQRALRNLAQRASIMERGTHLTHEPAHGEPSEKRHRHDSSEQERPVRCNRLGRHARRVDDPELRNTRVFDLRLLSDPAPVCNLARFGDSSLDFALWFWIGDPIQGVGNVRSAVLFALWDAFKREGIEIPYPVRDMRLDKAITVVVDRPG